MMQCANGEVVTSSEEIKSELRDTLENFFSISHQPTLVSEVGELQDFLSNRCPDLDKAHLINDITTKEITKVHFSMPSENSSGPYGYTVEF